MALGSDLLSPLSLPTHQEDTKSSTNKRSSDGYFVSYSPKSPLSPLAAVLESDSLRSCSSPSSSSALGSQDDRGSDNESQGTSEYFTAPEYPSVVTEKPYKSKNRSGSLDMTQVDPKPIKGILKGIRKRKKVECSRCRTRRLRDRRQSHPHHWWGTGASTPPKGFENYEPRLSTIDEKLRKSINVTMNEFSKLTQLKTPRYSSRRWSTSVVCGPRAPRRLPDLGHWDRRLAPKVNLDDVYRRLTQNPTPPKSQMPETPAMISLRRASGNVHPLAYSKTSSGSSTSDDTVFMLTAKDIMDIMKLIGPYSPTTSSLSKSTSNGKHASTSPINGIGATPEPSPTEAWISSQTRPDSLNNSDSSHSSLERGASPFKNKRGFAPRMSVVADLVTTVADAARPMSREVSFLDVSSVDMESDYTGTATTMKLLSKKSVHEIIWEDESPKTSSAVVSSTSMQSLNVSSDSQNMSNQLEICSKKEIAVEIPCSMTSRTFSLPGISELLERPVEGRVSHWELRPDDSMTEDNSLSAPQSPRQGSFSDFKFGRQDTILSAATGDVISFPPLPNRKRTGDWIIPPAAIAELMDHTRPTFSKATQKSVYGCGVDAVGIQLVDSAPRSPALEETEMEFGMSFLPSRTTKAINSISNEVPPDSSSLVTAEDDIESAAASNSAGRSQVRSRRSTLERLNGGKTPVLDLPHSRNRDPEKSLNPVQNPTTIFPKLQIEQYDTPSDHDVGGSPRVGKRKSVILTPSNDIARMGDLSMPGHAVGCSTGVRRSPSLRRRSSTRPTKIRFQHFNTFEELEDRKPWVKPRKDSGYPRRRASTISTDASSRTMSWKSQKRSDSWITTQ